MYSLFKKYIQLKRKYKDGYTYGPWHAAEFVVISVVIIILFTIAKWLRLL